VPLSLPLLGLPQPLMVGVVMAGVVLCAQTEWAVMR